MALGRPLKRASRPALLLAAAAVLQTACGAPNYHYIKSTSNRTYVRVPADWTLYDEDALLKSSDDSQEAKEQFKRLTWSVAFDADPAPSLEHVLSQSEHPTGLVQVRTLTPTQRDTFSLSDLRRLLLSFDPLSDDAQASGEVEVLDAAEIKREGGLHGWEFLLNLPSEDGDYVKWRQIALTDSGVTKVHVLAISCDAKCYEANEDTIDKVVESWKVKKR